jgi:hypothetical protein
MKAIFANILVIKILVFLPQAETAFDSVDPALQPVHLVVQSLNLAFKAVEPLVKLASSTRESPTREASARYSRQRDVQALSLLSMVHSGHLLIICFKL